MTMKIKKKLVKKVYIWTIIMYDWANNHIKLLKYGHFYGSFTQNHTFLNNQALCSLQTQSLVKLSN
jgi:hypothetical protein